jgi:hypothetical protein
LFLDSQNEHFDFAKIERDRAAFEIYVTPNRLLLYFADNACFLECLLGVNEPLFRSVFGPETRGAAAMTDVPTILG